MGVINTGLLTRDARSEFNMQLRAAQTFYQDWSTRIVSTRDQENYRWLGSVPQMREWGNGRVAKGLRPESYDVTNMKYEATLEVDRDEISDDQIGQIRPRIGELAVRAATHKDYLTALLLTSGAAAGFVSYDGVTFFNAAHVSGASGNQTNLATGGLSGGAITVDLFKAALKGAIAAMQILKDDQGQPMGISMSGLTCVVHPAVYFTALEAVNATVISNTSNVMQGVARVASLPWLTNAAVWYLLKTDGVIRPFIFQDREPIEFNQLAEGSEEEFRREKYLYGVRARYRMAYGYWQYAIQVTHS